MNNFYFEDLEPEERKRFLDNCGEICLEEINASLCYDLDYFDKVLRDINNKDKIVSYEIRGEKDGNYYVVYIHLHCKEKQYIMSVTFPNGG